MGLERLPLGARELFDRVAHRGTASLAPGSAAGYVRLDREPRTDFSSFFDYPSDTLSEGAGDLVFLEDRSEEDWAKLLAHTDIRRFRTGEEVMHAGDTDRALHIVTEGVLDAFLPLRGGGTRQFKSIEAPSVIGELSFIDGGPRSAILRAATDGELRRLSLESFEILAAREPELARAFLFDLSRIVSQRLRAATTFIAEFVA